MILHTRRVNEKRTILLVRKGVDRRLAFSNRRVTREKTRWQTFKPGALPWSSCCRHRAPCCSSNTRKNPTNRVLSFLPKASLSRFPKNKVKNEKRVKRCLRMSSRRSLNRQACRGKGSAWQLRQAACIMGRESTAAWTVGMRCDLDNAEDFVSASGRRFDLFSRSLAR